MAGKGSNLLGDLAVLTNRTRRLENRHYWLERITTDASNPLYFFGPLNCMLVEFFTGSIPVLFRKIDLILRDEAADRLDSG